MPRPRGSLRCRRGQLICLDALKLHHIGGKFAEVLSRAVRHPCESVSLEFAIGNPNPGYPANDFAGDLGTVTVVQETRDPVSASAPFNGLNSFTTGVVPGQSWSINLSETGPTAGEFGFYFYLNGYAVCDSAATLQPN